MVIERILGRLEDFQTEGMTIDRVWLDHHTLAKPHQKLKTESGMELAVSLPHGEHLYWEAVIYKDDTRLVVIDLVPEDVIEVRPEGTLEWGKAAFNIGNMHHPAYLSEETILIPYDGIIENMIQSMGIKCRRMELPLKGIRANHVHGHGHTHSHDHV